PWLNNKMPKSAQPPRRPWTAEEEEAIMREDLTVEQAAQLTGRTVTA
ncbi:MAG: hypothetical protein HOQ07_06630, partial [Sinomonas sp.]|nr:hypothetical protein [Sinomonas sp.]